MTQALNSQRKLPGWELFTLNERRLQWDSVIALLFRRFVRHEHRGTQTRPPHLTSARMSCTFLWVSNGWWHNFVELKELLIRCTLARCSPSSSSLSETHVQVLEVVEMAFITCLNWRRSLSQRRWCYNSIVSESTVRPRLATCAVVTVAPHDRSIWIPMFSKRLIHCI